MTATFYVGDALKVLATLPENSVDLVLTSPPFLALRSYLPADHPDKALEGGSQSTPGEYIDWLIDVVEACDRVLAPHGSLCFELGDTYAGSGGAGGDYAENGLREGQPVFRQVASRNWPLPKSLSLIPESFRFAMVYGFNPFTGRQTERWRLRNVIRWVRPNPPVGALGDKFRPATSELMVFCKSAKRFFDLDAVREGYKGEQSGAATTFGVRQQRTQTDQGSLAGRRDQGVTGTSYLNGPGAPPLDWWQIPETSLGEKVWWCAVHNHIGGATSCHAGAMLRDCRMVERLLITTNPAGAPLDWWNIPPGGYEGAHYAVWPPELLIKPIKAMCPEQVCRTCGEARRRIVEKSERYLEARALLSVRAGSAWDENSGNRADGLPSGAARAKLADGSEFTAAEYTTVGFSDCGHDDWRPGVVLDCFAGSGTTGAVASGHGRDSILIDLDERNWDLALERVGPLVLQRGEVAA